MFLQVDDETSMWIKTRNNESYFCKLPSIKGNLIFSLVIKTNHSTNKLQDMNRMLHWPQKRMQVQCLRINYSSHWSLEKFALTVLNLIGLTNFAMVNLWDNFTKKVPWTRSKDRNLSLGSLTQTIYLKPKKYSRKSYGGWNKPVNQHRWLLLTASIFLTLNSISPVVHFVIWIAKQGKLG